jgi:undecaprenyl-diphosphatase
LSAAFAALFVFVIAAAIASYGDAFATDEAILKALRRPGDPATPIGPAWLTALVADVTTLGGTPLMALFATILAGWFAPQRDWISFGMLVAATAGQAIVVQILKALFARPRPDVVPHLVDTTSLSFPSGHAASSAAFYLTLAALIALNTKVSRARRYSFLIAVLIAVAVGASRVYLGVHYPSDVIGGLAFGSAWAAFVILAARTLKKR